MKHFNATAEMFEKMARETRGTRGAALRCCAVLADRLEGDALVAGIKAQRDGLAELIGSPMISAESAANFREKVAAFDLALRAVV